MSLSRRTLLQLSGAAAAAGAAGAVGVGLSRAGADTEIRTQALIVGAGPGGAVAAERLSSAGIECTVLERGRRWTLGDFPAALRPDSRTLWLDELSPTLDTLQDLGIPGLPDLSSLPGSQTLATGLNDIVLTPTAMVMCGAGVGGSSLVYVAMLPQPTEDAFTALLPIVDYDELDRVYYPRARQGIGGGPIPDDVLAHPRYAGHAAFRDAARDAGVRVDRLFIGVDWDIVRKELANPLSGQTGASTGDYALTSPNSGAKLTVDRTYLARAEKTGRCTVKPLHQVVDVSAGSDGRYTVTAHRLGTNGSVQETVRYVADAVVMAAGAMHTPGMLVQARDGGGLPRLNDEVGRGWGTNADQFGIYPLLGTGSGGPPPFAAFDDTDEHAIIEPFPVAVGGGNLPASMFFLGMGTTTGNGTWSLDATGHPKLSWNPADDAEAHQAVQALSAKMMTGGDVSMIGLTPPQPSATVHPLGGAVLGRATDAYGRLDGYERLYCLDGSLLPGSSGAVNPTLTIAALVERCLDEIVSKDF